MALPVFRVCGSKVIVYSVDINNQPYSHPDFPGLTTVGAVLFYLLESNCKRVVLIAESDTLQSNKLIGEGISIDAIISNAAGVVTSGYSLDTETGVINDYPVAEGEKHIVFYTKP